MFKDEVMRCVSFSESFQFNTIENVEEAAALTKRH